MTRASDSDVVLYDSARGFHVTHTDLSQRSKYLEQRIPRDSLTFLLTMNTVDDVLDLLALRECHRPVALLNGQMSAEELTRLVGVLGPSAVIGAPVRGDVQDTSSTSDAERLRFPLPPSEWSKTHPDLAVVLTTSGTTGSSRFVKLSSKNITENAIAIAKSLELTNQDRGVTALPIHYSFGMSIVTSHHAVGSPIVVTNRSVLENEFWDAIRTFEVSMMPGVPSTFDILSRVGFGQKDIPTMRALIQAGGRMPEERVLAYHQIMTSRGGRLHVMYGQTEASPRMTCLPAEDLPEKVGSVGLPLDGCAIAIRDSVGAEVEVGEPGEVVFTGPNVMMGYASSGAELEDGDQLSGRLNTGDVGHLDPDGYLYLTGRTKRIVKIAGIRVSLDEIERIASGPSDCAAVASHDDEVALYFVGDSMNDSKSMAKSIARVLGLPPRVLSVRWISQLPTLPSGKVDYRTLASLERDDVDPEPV